MADKNFPGPSINHIIEEDPQIVKITFDNMGFGSRKSIFAQLSGDPAAGNANDVPGKPSAPEMKIKHV